jgi:hypothetical protein
MRVVINGPHRAGWGFTLLHFGRATELWLDDHEEDTVITWFVFCLFWSVTMQYSRARAYHEHE